MCFFNIFTGFTSDPLPPLAVIPLDSVKDTHITSLEQYAESSNSNLVYAHDEFRNDIAVGVFVTDDFHGTFMKNKDTEEQNYSTEAVNVHPNITWVAAVEECHGQKTEDISLKSECDDTQEEKIRVYKVEKKKKSQR